MKKLFGKKEINMASDAKVGWGEHLAYGVGNAANDISGTMIGSYILIYYTMVLGMDVLLATSVLAASRMMDGLSDLIMGRIIDRTQTKIGKAKPWYFRFILPMVISMLLVFNVPHNIGMAGQVIYMFLTYNLVTTICGTALGISFTSLNGLMTTNQISRGRNGVVARIFSLATGIFTSNTIFRFARFFGGGDEYSQKGWSMAMIVYAVVFVCLTLIHHFFTHERVNQVRNENEIADKTLRSVTGEKISAGKSLLSLIKNKFWVTTLVVCVFISVLLTINTTMAVYFSQYIMNDLDAQGIIISLISLTAIPGTLISLPLMARLGKRNVMLVGLGINLIGCLLPVFSMNTMVIYMGSIIKGLGYGITAGPTGSIIQDTLTYGEWKNGFSNMGMGNAANSFAMKASGSLGTIIVGFMLSISGFVEQSLVQSQQTLNMISFGYIWMPALMAITCIIIMLFYTLDKIYPQIEADLKEGKYAPGVQKEAAVTADEEKGDKHYEN